jgi:hypothetical protein
MHAMCDVQNASCDIHPATCEVRGETCEVRHARCDMRGARCDMRHATCEVRQSTCDIRQAMCNMRVATCEKQRASSDIRRVAKTSAKITRGRLPFGNRPRILPPRRFAWTPLHASCTTADSRWSSGSHPHSSATPVMSHSPSQEAGSAACATSGLDLHSRDR